MYIYYLVVMYVSTLQKTICSFYLIEATLEMIGIKHKFKIADYTLQIWLQK